MFWEFVTSSGFGGVAAVVAATIAYLAAGRSSSRARRTAVEQQWWQNVRWLVDRIEGELTDEDKLVYVNNVLKGKLLESEVLQEQAQNNTKGQFANSPDLQSELMKAIISAFAANTTMSTQALDSKKVQDGLRDILLGPAQLYESLKDAGQRRHVGGELS